VIVVDSSAIIAVFRQENDADDYAHRMPLTMRRRHSDRTGASD
jgi:uncharacterized protein with PIN domain